MSVTSLRKPSASGAAPTATAFTPATKSICSATTPATRFTSCRTTGACVPSTTTNYGAWVRAGLQPDHAILDYGCGTGHFVEHLKRRGYGNAVGYDAYSERFADPEVLHRTYDCVVAQDVLEHVPAPNELLDQFALLSGPNAIIAVGTPNASAIDLTRPEPSIHALHMPYHRHILSKEALLTAGRQRGWELERFYSAEYGNTAIPFLNAPFMSFYMRVADNSIDALFEPPSLLPLATRLPITLFLGLFGCLLAREVDVMAVFRKEAQAEAPPPLRRERASQAVFAQSA